MIGCYLTNKHFLKVGNEYNEQDKIVTESKIKIIQWQRRD